MPQLNSTTEAEIIELSIREAYGGGEKAATRMSTAIRGLFNTEQELNSAKSELEALRERQNRIQILCPNFNSRLNCFNDYWAALSSKEVAEIAKAKRRPYYTCSQWKEILDVTDWHKLGSYARKWLLADGHDDCVIMRGHNAHISQKGALLLKYLYIPVSGMTF